ncbi:MAG: type secretion system permease/ATPase [Devosia sp.]|nr:type secretion system permease/ATPase [Devosia sp.]
MHHQRLVEPVGSTRLDPSTRAGAAGTGDLDRILLEISSAAAELEALADEEDEQQQEELEQSEPSQDEYEESVEPDYENEGGLEADFADEAEVLDDELDSRPFQESFEAQGGDEPGADDEERADIAAPVDLPSATMQVSSSQLQAASPPLGQPQSRRQPDPEAPLSPVRDNSAQGQAEAAPLEARDTEFREPSPHGKPSGPTVIDADRGPLKSTNSQPPGSGGNGAGKGGGGAGSGRGNSGAAGSFHKRTSSPSFAQSLENGIAVVRRNLAIVMGFTVFINVLVLAIPIYLFQISDRVLTSRSLDTLVMLTAAVFGAVVLQAVLDAVRRFILMRTAVEVAVQLGSPTLSAAARASLHGNGRDYQVLGDLQQLRSFITSGTLLAFFDAPMAPLFVLAVYLIHPQLGYIVVLAGLCLLVAALINQRITAKPFADANGLLSRATLHLDSMSRNSQIINALAMIPEAVRIWGRDTAGSLQAQVIAQDRNIIMASVSKGIRLVTQVGMLGWGAYLSIGGEITGGMVIAASIIASRALSPIEGAIEGWNAYTQFRNSFGRIRNLLQSSPFNFERLILPDPKGRLDVERILFVPPPAKKVLLNGISFSLMPGESLAVIGNSGAGKTTLGKMLVGSVLPTSGSVRLDLMDLRNWDQRQFGENIGYLPQDVQLCPGTIKANIARMREDASDQAIYDAAVLADVHELVATFPQGYETYVAGDGAPLSGGQKQRIALARAFFGNPKLVVLDEPNSNLDAQGEAALAKALLHAKKEQITVVTITQRPALLNVVDKILVLNNGSVSMFGTRTQVLAELTRNKAGSNPGPNLSAPQPQPGF